ncbi:MAG: DUF1800 domain-containing protein [Alphaproteobacteria bacterium]|nr:MAG: DUF1800 domain-containing protein [Alphaproteobacteria bacterium]
MRTRFANSVVPAKAGTHSSEARAPERWIPAFAAITVVVLLFLGFCGAAVAADRSSDRQILHILDRLAFGPSAADVKHIKALGIDRYIAEQLDPASMPEPSALTDRLAALETLKLDPVQLFAEYGPLRATDGMQPSPEDQKARRQHARLILEQAQTARIWRALYSPRQLQEVMVDFWYNHFNVFANKALDRLWIGAYEAEAIRPHALGRFRDLLGATAHHPAMLFYLDNAQNAAAGSKGLNGREAGINENYARELMELHTLGADGGYTQDDVVALARILTGWGLARPNALPVSGSGFVFYPARHDNGDKHFLGQDIAGNGEAEGEAALDILAKSPATARHIAFELTQYFVADQPPPALVDRLATRFQETDGDIKSVLKALFASREFRDSAAAKYKSPYRFVLSAARAAGAQVDDPKPLLGAMTRLGQPLYGCMTPDGYRDTEAAWLSPDASLLRVNFAKALAGGNLPVVEGAKPVEAAPLLATLGTGLSGRTHLAVTQAPPDLQAALILGSPDFMRR